jgi:hypothetical protein
LIDQALVEAHHVNITADEVRAILEERLARMRENEVNGLSNQLDEEVSRAERGTVYAVVQS